MALAAAVCRLQEEYLHALQYDSGYSICCGPILQVWRLSSGKPKEFAQKLDPFLKSSLCFLILIYIFQEKADKF